MITKADCKEFFLVFWRVLAIVIITNLIVISSCYYVGGPIFATFETIIVNAALFVFIIVDIAALIIYDKLHKIER